MTTTVTTHDIVVDGVGYILEWRKSDNGAGSIAITEACTDSEPCRIIRENSHWTCLEHDWTSDQYCREGEEKPEECENYVPEDEVHMHETYDFEEVE